MRTHSTLAEGSALDISKRGITGQKPQKELWLCDKLNGKL